MKTIKETVCWDNIMYLYSNSNTREIAIEQAIKALEGYVFHVMKETYGQYLSRYGEDIYQQACMGIIKGLERYNHLESKPTTYFKFYIKGEIQQYVDYFIEGGTTHYCTMYRRANREATRLEGLKIAWTNEMIAENLKIPLETIENAFFIKKVHDELDSSGNLGDIPDPRTIKKILEEKELDEKIDTFLSSLTPDERLVINAKYGFEGEKMSRQKAARILCRSKAEILTVEDSVAHKLMAIFDDSYNSEVKVISEDEWETEYVHF